MYIEDVMNENIAVMRELIKTLRATGGSTDAGAVTMGSTRGIDRKSIESGQKGPPAGCTATPRETVGFERTLPVHAKGACENRRGGESEPCHRQTFPALAGMQTRLSQAGLCFSNFRYFSLASVELAHSDYACTANMAQKAALPSSVFMSYYWRSAASTLVRLKADDF